MTLEASVTNIADLNPLSPSGGDPKSDGDDHIRNIKKAIKATLPNVTGAVTASHTELNLLTGLTDVATQADIDQATLEATLPGVNEPANAAKFLRGDGAWTNIDLRGEPALDKGISGTTPQVLNYADGEGQTLTATGAHSLTVTGFPSGRFAGIAARLVDYGAHPLTTSGITWIKPDRSETTNFASAGIVLRAAGGTHVVFYSHGDGVVYGKLG